MYRAACRIIFVALFCVVFAQSTIAQEILLAKVYRDYPAYIEPPSCINPRMAPSYLKKPSAVKQPAAPVQPAAPAAQGQPVAVEQPIAPGQPAVPGQPIAPVVTGQPVAVEQPMAPGQPTVPGQPIAPAAPGQPVAAEQPLPPGQPAVPGQPIAPVAPGQPVAVEQPMAPGQPAAPGQPITPVAAGQPPVPGQPAMPGQPTAPEPPLVAEQPANNQTADPIASSQPKASLRDGHLYGGAWAGVFSIASNDMDKSGVDVDLDYDTGYAGALLIGYDFGTFRLDLEGSYRTADVDKIEINGNKAGSANGDIEIKAVLLNGYYDFITGGNYSPYVGAGLGWAKVSYDSVDANFGKLVDDDDTVLAGQLSAGVLFALNKSVVLDIGYRFLATEKPDLSTSLGNVDAKIISHTVVAGLQFNF